MASLTAGELDELQAFIKDWLRHAGRTQADLRRALQAGSIRMPVLMEVLAATHAGQGLSGLAAQLCAIEERWQGEDHWPPDAAGAGPAEEAASSLDASLGQLDLLLQEIRMDRAG
jgi:hypothetical protein